MQTIEIKKQNQEKQNERTYPYMGMEKNGYVVWFVKPSTGIAVIYRDREDKMVITSNWLERDFTPMQGEYTFNFDNK